MALQGVLRTAESLAKLNEIEKFNGIATKTSQIEKMSLAIKGLTKENALLLLANKSVNVEDQKSILIKAGIITKEEAETLAITSDTVATNTNTAAKGANLGITNLLTVAWAKLNAVIKANPFTAFLVVVSALGVAMGKIADRVYNAEKYAKKALDKSAEEVDNVKSEIESLNSELQTTQSRIDELNAKENLTLVEQEELKRLKETNDELERELRIKQSILSEEQKEANKDAKKYFTTKKDSLEFEVSYEGVEIHEQTDYIGTVEERIEKLQQYANGQIKLSEETIEAYKDYIESTLSDFMEEDDYLVEGQDDGILARLDALYEKYDLYANGKASVTEKKIKDILAKADFQDASKQLEELGKSGELSITTLSSRFPELIEYLDKAGISAQELYQYIMALSNPDAINYDNVRKQFISSLGFGDSIDSASEAQLWNEISALADEEIILNAYLKVRDQYGEHPEGWNAKDWISHIQSELETEIIEIDTQLSISETIDQLNTRLKPAFDSLQSAWQDIFTDDEFAINSIDILSTCDSIKSKLDEMSELGLDVDYSAFEDFVKVLRNTESTEEDVRNAFDSLATSITQAGLSGTEDFETMKAALEDLGVVNETIVAFQALAENTEALKESGLDLANATYTQLEAFAREKLGAEDAAQGVAILVYQQMLVANNPLDTMASIQALANLGGKAAETAGILAELAQIMAQISNLQSWIANNPGADASLVEATLGGLERKAEKLKSQIYTGVDFENVGGGASAASKAGSKAADAYLEAFEKEYDHLKDLLDRGEISEAQYLNRLRALYTRYFKDRKEYLDEYKKYESEYLSGMLDLHNKALSGISTLLNQKISAANDAKDAAISALQEEKEAAAEAYQAQIDAIEEEKDAIDKEIKQKEKKIDAINEEADAIRKTAETRKKNIDLQKEEADLERMLNQRTTSVYTEGKGFIFKTDTTGIRDAREKVKEAKEELEIDRLEREADLIQKEIDLLEEKKDALTEQQEAIQKMLDESNKFYDNLIKQQEKMWDSMIKGMEQQKSKWEELADIQQIAEAFSAVQQVFGEMGYSVEDVLNGSEAAFEDFKSKYISLISDVNSNSDFTDGLVYATGVAKENLGSFLDKTKETADGIDNLASKGTELNNVAEGMNGLATSASDANTNISETASNVGNVASNVDTLKTNLTDVNTLVTDEQTAFSNLFQTINDIIEAINQKTTAIQEEQNAVGIATSSEMADFLLLKEKILEVKETLDTISGTVDTLDTTPIDNLTESFQSLYEKILLVSTTLGAGIEGQGEGVTNSITSAIQALNEISFEEGIITQFNNLKAAIDSVSSAISGGGESSGGESQSGNSGSGKVGESGGKSSAGEGGGNSLTGAITSIGETANEIIGEPDAEGDGTVIGEFGAMETAVNDVTAAIGGGDSESGGGQDKSESDSNNLIGSIVDLGETTEETLGEPDGDGVIGRFGEFTDVVAEANEQVQGIADGLAAIDGQTVECTIKINIESDGFPAYASGTALGAMNLESTEYNAKYEGNAHVSGTANVTGNWGVRKPGKSLVGELGQELWVHSADGTFETVGDNGPEWINTAKGDLIFNHLQTKELLDKGNIVKTGKAYANGTVQYSDGTTILPDGSTLRPLQPGDKGWDLLQKFQPLVDKILSGEETIVSNAVFEGQRQMEKMVRNITNNTAINNISNNRNIQQPVVHQHFNITMPNVTDTTSATALMNDLQTISRKKYQIDW